jgi:phosphoglycerate kinase
VKAFRTLDEAGDLAGKRVLLRVDLNVPVHDGGFTDTTRIERVAPTIRELSDRGAKVALLAHFDRPKGKRVPEMSLAPVALAVANIVERPVGFIGDCIGEEVKQVVASLGGGGIQLLENTRFHPGEEKNDPAFSAALARIGDIYVNDAFSAAHRAHASTEGVAHLLPSFAGRAMQAELEALSRALSDPERPLIAIVGGAKISGKLELLSNLVGKVNTLVIGGGMANTFIAANGVEIGKSLNEPDLQSTAIEILRQAKDAGCAIVLPEDVVVAKALERNVESRTLPVGTVPSGTMILDVGEKTVAVVKGCIDRARTLVWNGPLGAFEVPPFDRGTIAVARHAAERTQRGRLLSVAGGGDTVAALNAAGVADDFSYVSTAGGAFLEWLEGKTLPGVEALRSV